MRRLPLCAAAGLVLLGATGCAPTSADDRPLVVVSTNILGDVVSQLVGDEARVLTLMPAGADPHSFEISAREAATMRSADLLVSNGLGLEEGLAQHLEAAESAGVPGFVAGEQFTPLGYGPGDAAETPDPHFWTDPARMSSVVDALVPVLSDLTGIDVDALAESTGEYRARLAALDEEMTASFATIPVERRVLVTNHHVFGYLANRFDFSVVGAVIPGGTTLAAPSASDLASLVTTIESTAVPAIFAESSSPDRLIQALAREADVHVDVVELFTESLTAADGDAPDYLTMMRVNTQRITSGLTR